MYSVWSDTSNLFNFPALEGDFKTDILIIGGGITGILCAYMLDRINADYILVEADTVCGGVTKNTTAKITFQHGLVYDCLMRRFGLEKTQMYFEANKDALESYRKLCEKIDCDFEAKDAFVYSLNNRQKIENELKALDRMNFKADFVKDLPLPFSVAGAVKFENQAQFHPLKFISKISQGLRVHEHTFVRELTEHTAVTDKGKITANKIIVATHFPFINKHGSYFIKQYQHRSYVLALENAPNVNGMYVDDEEKGMSFRNYEDMLLIGGGDHRTGKKGGNWSELEEFAAKYYPSAKERYRWATQDCMTLDDVPYIGNYSKNTPDFYVATGFNKWGMTSSMVAANILTDMVMGKESPYAEVFSPSRTILRPRLVANAFSAIVNMLSFSKKRCPHMGCALKWNPVEHSWDCPCHGSRFTKEGRLIDNPATGDLECFSKENLQNHD